MTIMRVSILVEVNKSAEDIRSPFLKFKELIETVSYKMKHNPDQLSYFLIKELNPDNELDWDEIENHKEVSTL